MPCFQLKDVFGETRWVEQGKEYYKVNGEEIVEGAIDWDCGEPCRSAAPIDLVSQMLQQLDQELGKQGAGEWIKAFAGPVAKQLGKANCMSCEVRRVVGDAIAPLVQKHGYFKAAKIVAKLVKDSFSKPELDILIELKGYLASEVNS